MIPASTRERKIGVVTGSRAEYGLLQPLLTEIKNDPKLELQLFVTGMHLSPWFGSTHREIEEAGFSITERIESQLPSDTRLATGKSIGLGTVGFAEAFDRTRPDILVLLGDRFEILAAAVAALAHGIPIAHLHGGEVTEGAFDDCIRHAITKMSHLHFTAATEYQSRVIQMGEARDRVYQFGALGLDTLASMPLMNREELKKELSFDWGEQNFIVTYHPVTLNPLSAQDSIDALLKALDQFPKAHLIFTKPNADPEGRVICQAIEKYVAAAPERRKLFSSLGQRKYFSVLKQADLVIGNSSSGIIEAPGVAIPTINIGDRQKGRLRADSVIDCEEKERSIVDAIRKGLSAEFRTRLKNIHNPYGQGGVAAKIKKVLKEVALEGLLRKTFSDIKPLVSE